ncbi:OsmC family protein [Chitinophaga barathri]|uniref:OsmC family peroxiredoxin n=1 Tax=Chitinophaga barathri TaxID=1647451 RepID=A0A3N4MD90_9BACT|nr:OsmC family protein [Chitinophaga barathri]RPD41415.1 OsmC family peroxiredoxin [Chitinophaga barathri]
MQYKMANPVRGTIGEIKYRCRIEWRNGTFIADEPPSSGGEDTGPDPFTLFLSSVVSCTLATLRMYIDRKGWNIPNIAINANLRQATRNGQLVTHVDKDLYFLSPVSNEQREKLISIAKACPVSRMLEGDIILTTLVGETPEVSAEMLPRTTIDS